MLEAATKSLVHQKDNTASRAAVGMLTKIKNYAIEPGNISK
jgi:hypothetical protein